MNKKSIIVIIILIILAIFVVYFASHVKVAVPTNDVTKNTTGSTLNAKYISTLDGWPPTITVSSGSYTCKQGGNITTGQGETNERLINGREYCVTIVNEGAAGSTYANYTYTTKVGPNIAKSAFVVRFVQCMNYSEPEQTECKYEQATFDPDKAVSAVVENYANSAPKEVPVKVGYVTGHITIGPFCPVEIEGHPCATPREAYSSRKVVVYGSDQVTEIKRVSIDTEGNYKVTIAPGTYWLQVIPAGIGPDEKKQVKVVASQTSTVDFDIDTGIR